MNLGTWVSLVSHALYSALVGAGIGWWVSQRGKPVSSKLPRAALLILSGVALHFFWDSVGALGPIIMPITFINGLILIAIVRTWTIREERPWARDLLAPEFESGLVTADEVDVLAGSPHDRRKFVRAVRSDQGKEAGKATRHVLDAELDLMDALCRSHGESTDEVEHAASEIARLRSLAASAS